MSRRTIRLDVERLVEKVGSTDPLEILKYLNVVVQFDDLGKSILGYALNYKEVIVIVLNDQLSELELYTTACHELGHVVCEHSLNTEFLKRSNLTYVRQGNEYEANVFMVELLTYGVNAAEFPSKDCLLYSCGIPKWAERYVDWNYIRPNADLKSFDSIY
ncbi:ImmA/IrrE family metallo-endopeptidase [uncultured Ligilactobacillus sp.]|uniref:ImmA/IrrE family metallo-endopeptidase n=1 Tax=uncultured Ligilactobacillus sp. TaxID=2837633 RepID=UPI00272BD22D|nr:ImmA/IrrE family metallo-endopeptidase [uncultured Ligilactobacillus sp.]